MRIERDLLDRFSAVARSNRRSVSQELRWLIDQHVSGHPQLDEVRPETQGRP
ncbi:MAG: hypothetical protein QM679_10080 [Patulibacter sp.]